MGELLSGLREYISRLFHAGWALFGSATLTVLLAVLQHYWPDKPLLQWWIGAVSILVFAPFQVFFQVWKEHELVKPTSLIDPWKFERGMHALAKAYHPSANRSESLGAATDEIRQAAADGWITIWGRETPHEKPQPPLVPIRKEYWGSHEIDISGHHLGLVHSKALPNETGPYYHLHLGAKQLGGRWKLLRPTLRRKIAHWLLQDSDAMRMWGD